MLACGAANSSDATWLHSCVPAVWLSMQASVAAAPSCYIVRTVVTGMCTKLLQILSWCSVAVHLLLRDPNQPQLLCCCSESISRARPCSLQTDRSCRSGRVASIRI